MQTQVFAGSLTTIFLGFMVLLITQSLYGYVPDRVDIAKNVVEDLQAIQWCGDNNACKNIAQQDLNSLELYQNVVGIKETGQMFGSALIILGSVFSILPPALELASLRL